MTLPPGRARLEANPIATGSMAPTKTTGDPASCLAGCQQRRRSGRKDDVDVEPHETSGDFVKLGDIRGDPELDDGIAPLDQVVFA